ncbi:MAG: twin-arginine translocase TatA/TatE family subunit [Candidatus Binatia bacterium]|nr:twin-arginine translocase TatA/TatE family subunit [Candidatus Binatia bacterium]
MLGLGLGELIILLVIVLIIFGAGRLPELGESLGRGIRNFRKQLRMPDEIDVTPRNVEDEPSRPQDKDQP